MAEAYLLQGQALKATGRIKAAAYSYLESYKAKAGGKTAPQALIGLASSLGEMNQKAAACKTLSRALTQFPKSEEANLAENLFSKLGCS